MIFKDFYELDVICSKKIYVKWAIQSGANNEIKLEKLWKYQKLKTKETVIKMTSLNSENVLECEGFRKENRIGRN
jgi:hypothetical protein